ncbi:MAG TPA: hypothetical protein VGF28_09300 [Thermoanaerobaculia bacterium]
MDPTGPPGAKLLISGEFFLSPTVHEAVSSGGLDKRFNVWSGVDTDDTGW